MFLNILTNIKVKKMFNMNKEFKTGELGSGVGANVQELKKHLKQINMENMEDA